MTLRRLLVLVLLFSSNFACAQKAIDSLLQLGDSFYKKQEYLKAAPLWAQAAELADHRLSKNTYYYYTANAYAKATDSANSFKCLQLAILDYGYNDLATLESDDSFNFMHRDSRWNKLLKSIKPNYTRNPRKAKIIDQDVKNFWIAYDLVQKTPDIAEAIYKEHYIDKGTNALQFYYLNKIGNTRSFVRKQNRLKKYYTSVRENTLKGAQLKRNYIKSFIHLKKLYPQAIFPDVYFVIGSMSSGGTISSDGLILGIDQAVMSPAADTTGLTTWEKNNISPFQALPHTVAHELIHSQQNAMASDTTLLRAVLIEGMADFIGELISGKTANERLHVFAKGKEKQIWDEFKKEMYLNRARNWIANSDQETPDKPADLGYWVGYQICKAYYNEAKDKKQAIYDMLHIKDYKKFFIASKLDQ